MKRKILEERPFSTHPDDSYLTVVLAEVFNSSETEYVTWIRNQSGGDFFSEGHYFSNDDYSEAYEDFLNRR